MNTKNELRIWSIVCATVISCVMLICLKDMFLAHGEAKQFLPCNCSEAAVSVSDLELRAELLEEQAKYLYEANKDAHESISTLNEALCSLQEQASK